MEKEIKCFYCAAMSCQNSTRNCTLTFFKFPTEPQRFKLWALACGRRDLVNKNSKLYTNYRLCAAHFTNEMFSHPQKLTLRRDAVPAKASTERLASFHSTLDSIKISTSVPEFPALCQSETLSSKKCSHPPSAVQLYSFKNGLIGKSRVKLSANESRLRLATNCALKNVTKRRVRSLSKIVAQLAVTRDVVTETPLNVLRSIPRKRKLLNEIEAFQKNIKDK